MRVAIVAEVYLPKIDGVVARTTQLIRHLLAQGDEVVVVCPYAPGPRDSPPPLVEFRSFPLPSYPEYLIGIPDESLAAKIDAFGPDVIHYLNPFIFGFQCFDIMHRAKSTIPSLFSFHTLYGDFVKSYPFMAPLSPIVWWLTRSYHNCADLNLTVSESIKAELVSRGFERLALWPPAVDSELFSPARSSSSMRERLSKGGISDPLVLTVSRLAPEKNVAFLAEVMQQLPHARLAIVGDGPHRCELERQFAGTNAHFVGYLTGTELATAYASSDLFLYASTTETMGNVILEAMSSGLGVVAPRAGGISSLIDDGRTGVLYEPNDIVDAVSRVSKLLTDRERLRIMGDAAVVEVADWSWERSVSRVRDCYSDAIRESLSERHAGGRRRWLVPKITTISVRIAQLMAARNRNRAPDVTESLRATS